MGTVLPFTPRVEPLQVGEALRGIYLTDRHGRIAYAYAARWSADKGRICWHADVRRNGVLKGAPTGTFTRKWGMAVSEQVRCSVENAIESLAAVTR